MVLESFSGAFYFGKKMDKSTFARLQPRYFVCLFNPSTAAKEDRTPASTQKRFFCLYSLYPQALLTLSNTTLILSHMKYRIREEAGGGTHNFILICSCILLKRQL